MRIRGISITCSRGDEQSAGEGAMSTGAERGKAEAQLARSSKSACIVSSSISQTAIASCAVRDERLNRTIPTNAWNTILSPTEVSVLQGRRHDGEFNGDDPQGAERAGTDIRQTRLSDVGAAL